MDIEGRLLNWSAWARGRTGPRTPASITGAICESMRRAALGNVWSGHDEREPVNDQDALLIERAMHQLDTPQLLMLVWHYVRRAPKHIVCRSMKIPHRPAHVYDTHLALAHDTLRKLLT